MPIDWAAVNWVNVGLLSAFAFLATLIGGILSFNNRWIGAIWPRCCLLRFISSGPIILTALFYRE